MFFDLEKFCKSLESSTMSEALASINSKCERLKSDKDHRSISSLERLAEYLKFGSYTERVAPDKAELEQRIFAELVDAILRTMDQREQNKTSAK